MSRCTQRRAPGGRRGGTGRCRRSTGRRRGHRLGGLAARPSGHRGPPAADTGRARSRSRPQRPRVHVRRIGRGRRPARPGAGPAGHAYHVLGLNCQVSARQANPQRWLIERFGAGWLGREPMVREMRPKFALDAGDAVCHIGLVDAPNSSEWIVLVSCVRSCFAVAGACDTAARAPFACRYGPIRYRVTLGLLRTDLQFGTLDCNVHHQAPSGVDGLCAAIERWPERQTFVRGALATLFGS